MFLKKCYTLLLFLLFDTYLLILLQNALSLTEKVEDKNIFNSKSVIEFLKCCDLLCL